ncbi:hypothetical protein RhiirB3_436041 [Rhizophagus irregularis]|nr:hypothetical protein RhiirB3_436041 [Rhizophagus irregularis]
MEDDLFYQKGNKFTPKELKDCPECGNKEIVELIRYTQLNAHSSGFSSVYSALFVEVPNRI